MGTRLLAAISEGDWNIVLTSALSPDTRMMIRRKLPERLTALAPIHQLGRRSLPGAHRRRPPGVDRRRLPHQRIASLFARRRDGGPRPLQLHPQFGEGHRRRLRRRRPHVRLRHRRSADSRLSASVSGAVHAGLGHARRAARAHARAGNAVPRAGGNLPHLSHARSRILLQSRRSVGPRDVHHRAGRPARRRRRRRT